MQAHEKLITKILAFASLSFNFAYIGQKVFAVYSNPGHTNSVIASHDASLNTRPFTL